MANENMPKIPMSQVRDYIVATINNGGFPFLHGPSGCGKTQSIEQAAKSEAERLKLTYWTTGMTRPDLPWQELFFLSILPAHGLDMMDIKGGGAIDKNGPEWTTKYARPELLPSREDGAVIWMNIDEVSQSLASTINALRPLVLTGVTSNYVIPPGTKILATGNRPSDKANTTGNLGGHFYQVFDHVECIPDKEGFIQWLINTHGMGDGFIPAFLRFSKDDVFFNYDAKKNGIVFSTSRKLTQVHNLRNTMPYSDLRDIMVASKVGSEVQVAMNAYDAMRSELTSFSSIVASPTEAKIPDCSLGDGALGATYAIISMAAASVTVENVEAVCVYINRLDRGFGSTFVGDVIANPKTKAVVSTKAFSTLRIDLGDMIQ